MFIDVAISNYPRKKDAGKIYAVANKIISSGPLAGNAQDILPSFGKEGKYDIYEPTTAPRQSAGAGRNGLNPGMITNPEDPPADTGPPNLEHGFRDIDAHTPTGPDDDQSRGHSSTPKTGATPSTDPQAGTTVGSVPGTKSRTKSGSGSSSDSISGSGSNSSGDNTKSGTKSKSKSGSNSGSNSGSKSDSNSSSGSGSGTKTKSAEKTGSSTSSSGSKSNTDGKGSTSTDHKKSSSSSGKKKSDSSSISSANSGTGSGSGSETSGQEGSQSSAPDETQIPTTQSPKKSSQSSSSQTHSQTKKKKKHKSHPQELEARRAAIGAHDVDPSLLVSTAKTPMEVYAQGYGLFNLDTPATSTVTHNSKRGLAAMATTTIGAGVGQSVSLQARSEGPKCDALPFAKQMNQTITSLKAKLVDLQREREALLLALALES